MFEINKNKRKYCDAHVCFKHGFSFVKETWFPAYSVSRFVTNKNKKIFKQTKRNDYYLYKVSFIVVGSLL